MRNHRGRKLLQWVHHLFLAACFLSACGSPTPTAVPTLPAPPTPTLPVPLPSPSPTPQPPGTPSNPLTFGFVSETNDPAAPGAADAFAAAVAEDTGLAVRAILYPDYDHLLDALLLGEAHAAWLPPFTYLAAHNRGIADVTLVSNHFGATAYGVQFLVRADSGYTLFYDPGTGESSAGPETALLQLQDRRPCWVDERSASGYVVPLGYMSQLGLVLRQGVQTQTHAGVVRSVYAGGICDFGVTYATYGDPRTGQAVQAELPDVMNQVVILWQSTPVIPSHSLSFLPELDPNTTIAATNAVRAYASTPEGAAALTQAAGYEISAVQPADDAIYDDLRGLLDSSGVKLRTLIGR